MGVDFALSSGYIKTMRYGPLLIAINGLAVLGVVGFPTALKQYSNYSYDVNIERIRYGYPLGCMNLTGINTDKGYVSKAKVCYPGKYIKLYGGEVFINKSLAAKSANPKGWQIEGSGIDVNVLIDDYSVFLKNASISNGTICADELVSEYGYANDVCVNLKNKEAYIHSLKLDRIGFTDPTFGEVDLDFQVNNIYANEFFGEIGSIDSSNYNIKGSGITITRGDSLDVIFDTGSIKHDVIWDDWISVKNVVVSGIDLNNIMGSKIDLNIKDTKTLIDLEERVISGNESCNDWISIVPEELRLFPISDVKLKGSFRFDIKINPTSVKIDNSCKIDGPVPGFISDLRNKFKYNAYHPDGSTFEREIGPFSGGWVGIERVSSYLITALTMTEDPGFFSHNGIIPKAIENSLKENIKLGKIHRGGSTITMQLAKNLWLNRSRNVGRKVQEGILTIALESCLTKEQILETYLNVVEFGPDTYGIMNGTEALLGKRPSELTMKEALYMALRLPSPNKNVSMEDRENKINKLIDMGIESGKISEEDLEYEIFMESE